MTISIIMPAYNAANTISDSMDSVLSQTHGDWELIVVDDASTDDTVKIVENYAKQDTRIKLYKQTQNHGVAHTRNFAIQQAKSTWLAFLDSDDLWNKDKLALQLQFAAANNAKLTYTATAYINDSGVLSEHVLPAQHKLSYTGLLMHNLMSCSSVMVHRSIMQPFPCLPRIHEDYVVWLQLVRQLGHAYGLNQPLLIYRMGRNSKSSARIKSAIMTWRAYREVGIGVLRTCIYTLRYSLYSIRKRRQIKFAGDFFNG